MAVETTTFSNNSADTWFRDIMFDCVLCPRACHVNRLAGQTGYCGQTAELMAARASCIIGKSPVFPVLPAPELSFSPAVISDVSFVRIIILLWVRPTSHCSGASGGNLSAIAGTGGQ